MRRRNPAVGQATEKPVAVLGNSATTMSVADITQVRRAGIPVLMGTEPGLRALKHFVDYPHRRKVEARLDRTTSVTTDRWLARLRNQPGTALPAAEGFSLLADYGVNCAAFRQVAKVEEAIGFAEEVGYPIVLKVDDPAIPHKSDVGGVIVGIRDAAMTVSTFSALSAEHPRIPLLVQKHMQGIQLILGMTQDADFGPLLSIGLGGIFTEILKDVALLVPPVTDADALDALTRLKAYPVLRGARGGPRADLSAIASAIVSFGRLATDLGDRLSEIEINPLLSGPDGAYAVDCLAVLQTGSENAS